MSLFFISFFTLYTLLNYYVFVKAYKLLPNNLTVKLVFIILFVLISFGYVLSKSLYKHLSIYVYDIWLTVGAIWFAMLVYFVLLLFIIDLALLINRSFKFIPIVLFEYKNKLIAAFVIFLIVSIIVFIGNLNKRDIIVTEIEIQLRKEKSKLDSINIVLASDIHLSSIDGEKLLPILVDKINSLNPDIILFAGDIVDDRAEVLEIQGIGKSLLSLKSKFGIYSIAGNHEFINGIESSINFARSLRIEVIRDSAILIGDSFYIIGRDDTSKFRFEGVHRKTLANIIKDLDDYPKILLDHTPLNLSEAVANKIDIQLSGHTHHGQLFPANLITSVIYEISRGYKRKSDTHFYVTTGAGTWGPPVRIGSKSEVVNIKLSFN
jgi:predicted MPP superfamily phosphohydrolase